MRSALEMCAVRHRHDPRLIRNSRSIWTRGDVVSPDLNDAIALLYLLRQNVAKHATLFLCVVFAGCAQLVEHASWNERRSYDLRCRMIELLSAKRSVVLVNADVLEAMV